MKPLSGGVKATASIGVKALCRQPAAEGGGANSKKWRKRGGGEKRAKERKRLKWQIA